MIDLTVHEEVLDSLHQAMIAGARVFFAAGARRVSSGPVYNSPCAAGVSAVDLQEETNAMTDKTTHFGFRQVPVEEKTGRVREVFDSVAGSYDIMNDVMSFGIHRIWKKIAMQHTGLKPGDSALDVAGGTGDGADRFHGGDLHLQGDRHHHR